SREAAVTAADLPASVFQCVLGARETLVLNDASGDNRFLADDYVRRHRARSVLCIPLLERTQAGGGIYLQHKPRAGVFSPDRLPLLEVLACHAAVALENARLHRDLHAREARVGRLVDSNIIGIVIWHADGRILDANDSFLRIVGYAREELVAGRVGWTDLTP